MLGLMLIASPFFSGKAFADENAVPDMNFRHHINKYLGRAKPYEQDVLPSDVDHIVLFIMEEKDISSIEGIQHFKKLKSLYMGNNNISDLGPLKDMKRLKTLYFDNNKVKDLTPIAGLTEMDGIVMNGNDISDLSPLSGMKKLRILRMDGTLVTDLGPLSGITNLNELEAEDNSIEDLRPLASVTGMKELFLSDNEIKDISPLSNLHSMTRLFIDGNHVADMSPMKDIHLDELHANDQTVEVTAKKGQVANPPKARDGSAVTDLAELQNLKLENGNLALTDKSKGGSAKFTAENGNFTGTITVRPVATYTLKVNNGKADQTSYEAGEKVTLTADKAAVGKEFSGWKVIKGDVKVAEDGTFTMPANDVEVKAVYRDKSNDKASGEDKNKTDKNAGPSTGDGSQLPASMLLLALSAAGLYAFAGRKRRA